MGVAEKALRLLWPKGKAHALLGDSAKLITGLGVGLDRVHDAARMVLDESIPFRALVTLPDWHAALGIPYDSTLPIDSQRIRLDAVWSAVGGMTLNDLQEQVQKEFPGVFISEVSVTSECGLDECGVAVCNGQAGDYSPTFYDVTGEVNDDAELMRLGRILDHFAPAHLIANIIVDVLSITATSSEAGDDICGLSVAEGGSGPLAPTFTGGALASGVGLPGALLIAYPGEVIGGPTPILSYQWRRDGADIGGATSRFYTIPLSESEAPGVYTCQVTATNASGSASSISSGITCDSIAPQITNAYVFVVDQTTLGVHITATGFPSPTYAFQWRKGGVNIEGAISPTYAFSTAGVYDCIVTASNMGGSDTKMATSITLAAPAFYTTPYLYKNGTFDQYHYWCGNYAANSFGLQNTYTFQFKHNGVNYGALQTEPTSPYIDAYDLGGTWVCLVTATNSLGSTQITSTAYGP
jgi:hypothetical protein